MGNLATDQDYFETVSTTEPEYLLIRSAAVDYRAAWDCWAQNTVEWLTSNGWKQSRVGPLLIVQHHITCQ